mgnify:CR=1 FL=1
MIESCNYNIFSVGSFILLSVIVVILAVFMSSNCSKQVEDCKEYYCHKIKERDYLYCVILLFIVIVFICTITMIRDENVADYLSFAGTVSSIILSVLAIIMTILAEKKMEIEKIKTNGTIKVLKDNNEITDTNTLVGTGMQIQIETERYIAIVKADLNGDGKIGLSDLSNIKFSLIGKKQLSTEAQMAGDINGDGKETP